MSFGGKGGHSDPSQLNAAQAALAKAPISGSYMNVAPPRSPMMSAAPGLFGLSGAAPPPAYIPRLTIGQPAQMGGGKGGLIGQLMGGGPAQNPLWRNPNPMDPRGTTPPPYFFGGSHP